jgi:hypothetical protein
MKGSSAAHTALCRAILVELGSLPGVIIGMNPSGRAKYIAEKTGRTSVVPYGWPSAEGGPDLLAVVAPHGRLVGLEVKTGGATTTKEQRAVHTALRTVGVVVKVVRSVDEARVALDGVSAVRAGTPTTPF